MDAPFPKELLAQLRSQPDTLVSIIQRLCLQYEQLSLQFKQLSLRNEQLLNENTALRIQNSHLNDRLRALEAQDRPPPAAPFSRKHKNSNSKPHGKPGRKPGHPPAWKTIPDHFDEVIDVPLDPCCPHCKNTLSAIQPLDQYIEDIVVHKHITHLRTHQGWCPTCECVVASTHPRQVSWAGGAAGTHLGARALALACLLKHQMGLSFAKTGETLRQISDISITPGGLAQLFQRVAKKLDPDYQAQRAQLLQSPSVHTDETSWWVGGPKASLCVYCTPQLTHYRVVESKDRETFHETIPANYSGVLVSDCLSVYDGATPHQQKCYAHHLKAISQAMEEGADAGKKSFLQLCKNLLRGAMKLARGWEKRAPPQREEQLRILKLTQVPQFGKLDRCC